MSGLYFIDHAPDLPGAEEFRQAAADILALSDFQPYYPQHDSDQADYLLKTCQNIFLTSFAIFELSTITPTLLIEIGIALGLNKPFVVFRRDDSNPAGILEKHRILTYHDQQYLATLLLEVAHDVFERRRMKRLMPEYCTFCQRDCPGLKMQAEAGPPYFFLLNSAHPEHQALYHTYAQAFAPTRMSSEILTRLVAATSDLPLCNLRHTLQGAKFTLLNLDPPLDFEQYIALGLAIGMRIPWVVTVSQETPVPALLAGTRYLQYDSFKLLAEKLTEYIYKMFMPGGPSGRTAALTARLDLPFWLQLEDWLARYKSQSRQRLRGVVFLQVREGNQMVEQRRLLPNTQVVLGRNPDCDVVINSPLVSRRHAILHFQEKQVFITDLESRGGVFIDGRQVTPDTETPIHPGQSIRLGASYFTLILSSSEEPAAADLALPQTDLLPPLGITVSLGDGLVLDHKGELVARLTSQELALLEVLNAKRGEVCTHEEIALALYGKSTLAGLRMRIAALVNKLRDKVEVDPGKPEFIVSVSGQGYKLLTRAGKLTVV